jgi:hypothetical protein
MTAAKVWRTRDYVLSRLRKAAMEPPSRNDPGNYKRGSGDCWRMVLLSDLQELMHHVDFDASAQQPALTADDLKFIRAAAHVSRSLGDAHMANGLRGIYERFGGKEE